MKILRFNLSNINSWPGKEIGESSTKYVCLKTTVQIVLNLFCLGTGMVFMVKNSDKSFFELGHMIITCMMGFVALVRTL